MAYNMKQFASLTMLIVVLSFVGTSSALTPTLGQFSPPGPFQQVDFNNVSDPCLQALEKLVPGTNGSDIATLVQGECLLNVLSMCFMECVYRCRG